MTSASLEILHHPAQGPVRNRPLLFIHGAFTGAWCWEDHFLPYFARAGYDAYALSLSGHGKSSDRGRFDSLSIADYVEDVSQTIESLDTAPLLIGHSMGGFVLQKYLEHATAPGAALLCTVPPQGLMSAAFGLLFSRPSLLKELNTLMAGGRGSLDAIREALFAQPIDVADLKRFLRQAQTESYRAIWDMSLFNLPRPRQVVENLGGPDQIGQRLLVAGAEFDRLMPASTAVMTARSYGVEPVIFPGLGHGIMLEHDWETVAGHLREWADNLTQASGTGRACQETER
ncbi:MAG TPA: alpha/beta hydrolase [Rhodocyclaceae bacterium]|nr:alpha/beta hydrolase [Rhodocyclaceae bacterium]